MAYYELFAECKYDRTCGFYDAYGIVAFESGQIARIIRDISPDKHKIDRLARQFNTEQLELQHLSQAVEDFLYDFEV